MRFPTFILAAVGAAALLLGGCSTEPDTSAGQAQLQNDSPTAVKDFIAVDPSFDSLIHNSYGYAIFPSIGKGAVGVGGAYGHGEVFERGKRVGYADMTQATVGASIGGETYAELILFQNPEALQRFKTGQLTFAADASAVAAKAGAAADAKWEDGMSVFINVNGGLMTEASVGGQKFNYDQQ
ncbi:MAG: YSC84-related protein [Tepidisphaeraceae bacterium]|jgi:lipid-binding SYLF domain-containing protein